MTLRVVLYIVPVSYRRNKTLGFNFKRAMSNEFPESDSYQDSSYDDLWTVISDDEIIKRKSFACDA